ncbi:MAG TPA: PEP-CTERM sorting domain-containing protein [Acidobacteriaceae bacterium]|jgi:hypothetical protein
MKLIHRLPLFAAACLTLLSPGFVNAQIVNSTVNATDNIYASGSQSDLVNNCVAIGYCGAGGQGTLPGYVSLAPGATYVTVSATGTISLDGNDQQFNDPDGYYNGVPAYSLPAPNYTSSNGGLDSISGITAPGAGYLVGLFVGPSGPTGTAPASLDYSAAGSESDTSYSPLLDQVFFIGDGLTGDGSGTTQEFIIPTGATKLYLGISDACFFQGAPSCYQGNDGSYNAVTDVVTPGTNNPPPSATPEPSSLMLLGTGLLGATGMLRRRMSSSR